MKNEVIAVLIIFAFSLVLLSYAVVMTDFIFPENRSASSSGINISAAGMNLSTGRASEGNALKNVTVASTAEAAEDPFFQIIAEKALGFGEYVRYDGDEMEVLSAGDEKSDISLSVDRPRLTGSVHIKDLYSGYEYSVLPPQGFKFLLVSVTAAPVGKYLERHPSPMTKDFRVIDPSGEYSPRLVIIEELGAVILNSTSWDTMMNERFVIRNVGEIYVGESIFSSLNDVEGSGSVTGWIIYEVPEDFLLSDDTFLELEIGNDVIYWKLHDILVDLRVRKNSDTGRITISYNGGVEGYLIRAMEAELVRADGSVDEKSAEAGEDEEYLEKTEIYFSGTAGEQDLLTVKVIRLDGEEFVKHKKWI